MWRRGQGGGAGALTAAAGLLAALTLAGAPAAAAAPAPVTAPARVTGLAAPAAPAALPAPLPPPPPCATAVSLSDGKATTKALPLPAPASAVGGERLAQPGLQVELPPGVPRPPALRTTAWVVADLDTGAVVASCNAHVPLAPASTLKVLTALALHPRIGGDARYVARPQDASVDGTKVGLSPGSLYSGADLWHGLMLGSGNDAATGLAELAGGMPAATALMTQTARALGAQDTVVANTSGLDAPGQVSSAYDLALFGRALLRDPALASLVRTRIYAFPSKGTAARRAAKTYQIANHNLLLARYPGATGVKNGYTTAAGASLVASARRGAHGYIVTLLRGQPDVFHMGAALLDWAFAHASSATPIGTLDVPAATSTSPAALSPGATAPAAPAGAGPVANAVAGPVKATLGEVPDSARTGWLLGAVAVAVAGAALVRRTVLRRAVPARRTTGSTVRARRTPRRPSTGSRPAAKRPAR